MLGYTKIEAPFDGIVTQRNVNTGDLTQPGADKPPLFVVARSDIVTIRVNVPEAFAAEVNPGDRAAVKLQEMKGKTVEGKVTRISWALDPKTRTLRVEIDIPNPGGTAPARPLRLRDRHRRRAHRRPDRPGHGRSSRRTGKAYCVVVVAGKAVRRPIQLGPQRRHADRGRLGPGRRAKPWSRPTPPRSPTASPSRSSIRPAEPPQMRTRQENQSGRIVQRTSRSRKPGHRPRPRS